MRRCCASLATGPLISSTRDVRETDQPPKDDQRRGRRLIGKKGIKPYRHWTAGGAQSLHSGGILRSPMLPDVTKLSEDELMELNRRIVERLQLLRSARSLVQLARFSVGMAVEFDTDDGRTVTGTIARLNQRTATVVTASGCWRASPGLLRPTKTPHTNTPPPRALALPRRTD